MLTQLILPPDSFCPSLELSICAMILFSNLITLNMFSFSATLSLVEDGHKFSCTKSLPLSSRPKFFALSFTCASSVWKQTNVKLQLKYSTKYNTS